MGDLQVVGQVKERGASAKTTARKGLTFSRYFTKPTVSPYDEIEWELRTASIGNEKIGRAHV